jgi:DNA-binding PadR family transcriptional regulator
MKAFMDKSINFFWSAELSQIYRELSKLENQGFVYSNLELQEGRPNKKVYVVTEKGRTEFIQWLSDFPEDLVPISRNEFLVRVFFSSQLPEEQLVYQLKRYIRQQEENIKIYSSIDERLDACVSENHSNTEPFYQRLTVRRGLYFAQSEIKWAKECIEEIHRKG